MLPYQISISSAWVAPAKSIIENASLFDLGKRYGKQEKEDLIGWLKKSF